MPKQGHHQVEVEGLGQDIVHARRQGRLAMGVEGVGGEGDDRQGGQGGLGTDEPGSAQPVHHRHLQVHEHGGEGRGRGQQAVQGLPSIVSQGDLGTLQPQGLVDHLQILLAVVHDQDVGTQKAVSGARVARGQGAGFILSDGPIPGPSGILCCPHSPGIVGRGGIFSRGGDLAGQFKPEGGPPPRLVANPDLTPHEFHQPLTDGQTQPGASPGVIDAHADARTDAGTDPRTDARIILGEEGREDQGQILRGDAATRIPHLAAQADLGLVQSLGLDPHHHLPLVGELDGVVDQVGQDLLEPVLIQTQGAFAGRGTDDAQGEPLGLGQGHHEFRQAGHQPGQVAGSGLEDEMAGLDLGQVQEVVEDEQQGVAGVVDPSDHGPLARGEGLPGQQLGLPQHQVERIADFMTDTRQEVALGPVGGLGPLPGLAQVTLMGEDFHAADEEPHSDGVAQHQGDPDPAFNLPGPGEIRHEQQGEITGDQLVQGGEEGRFPDPGEAVAVDIPQVETRQGPGEDHRQDGGVGGGSSLQVAIDRPEQAGAQTDPGTGDETADDGPGVAQADDGVKGMNGVEGRVERKGAKDEAQLEEGPGAGLSPRLQQLLVGADDEKGGDDHHAGRVDHLHRQLQGEAVHAVLPVGAQVPPQRRGPRVRC